MTGERMRRSALIGFAVLAALVLVASLALTVFFPTERATAFAVSRLEASTGRAIAVGSSSVRILPEVRLVLGDVSVGEKAEPGAPRVSAAAIELGVRLLPLLRRRVEVRGITITDPVIEAILPDESASAPPSDRAASSDGESAPRGGGMEIRIDELVVTGARVEVRAPDGRPFLEIADLGERLTARARSGGDLELSGVTRASGVVLHLPAGTIGEGLALTFRKSLRYDAAADRLELIEASIDVAGVPVGVSGHVDGAARGGRLATLSLEGGPGEVESLLGLLPAGFVPELDGVSSSGTLSLTGRVRGALGAGDVPWFEAELSLTNGRIRHPELAATLEDITLRLLATRDEIQVTELSARSSGSSMRAHASVTDYRTTPTLKLALDADADMADVAAFSPKVDSLGLSSGRVTAAILAEGRPDDPAGFAISGTVNARGLGVRHPALAHPIRELDVTAVLDRRTITIQSASGRLGSSDFAISGRLENPMALDTTRTGLGRAGGVFNLRSSRLDLDELMLEPGSDGGPRGGRGSTPPGESRIASLPNLDGSLVAVVDALRLRGADARNVTGRLTLTRGVVGFEDVSGDVFGGRARVGGTMSLPERASPSFDVAIEAERCSVAEVFAYQHQLGRLSTVARHLTGTMSTKTTMKGALDDTLGLVVDALESAGEVWMTNAVLKEHPAQKAVASFLSAPSLETLGIRDVAESFTIRDGRLRFDDLSLRAGDVEAVGSGFSTIDGRYEMTLDLWLPRSIASGARDRLPPEAAALLFGGDEARLMLPVKIAGSRATAPSVSVEVGKLTTEAKARAAARLEAEKARLVEEAKGRAEAAAGALVSGAKPDSLPIPVASKAKVEEKVKDALEGIFGKKR